MTTHAPSNVRPFLRKIIEALVLRLIALADEHESRTMESNEQVLLHEEEVLCTWIHTKEQA